MSQPGVFGTSFESILPITGVTAMTSAQASYNLVLGVSGMPATVTLPAVSAMVANQNLMLFIANKSTSGGTLTIAAASGDSIVGATTVTAGGVGLIARHDGLKTWFTF